MTLHPAHRRAFSGTEQIFATMRELSTQNGFEHPAARSSGGRGGRGRRGHRNRFSELRTMVLMELYIEPITSQSVITKLGWTV
jgi:hypothetical protein